MPAPSPQHDLVLGSGPAALAGRKLVAMNVRSHDSSSSSAVVRRRPAGRPSGENTTDRAAEHLNTIIRICRRPGVTKRDRLPWAGCPDVP